METLILVGFAILIALTAALLAIGQERHWGLTPISLLGLGFIIPFLLMLVGAI